MLVYPWPHLGIASHQLYLKTFLINYTARWTIDNNYQFLKMPWSPPPWKVMASSSKSLNRSPSTLLIIREKDMASLSLKSHIILLSEKTVASQWRRLGHSPPVRPARLAGGVTPRLPPPHGLPYIEFYFTYFFISIVTHSNETNLMMYHYWL